MTDQTPPPRRRRWRRGLFELALILLIVAGVQWWKSWPLATGAAPSLAGVTLDGRPFDLAQWQGQPVLVHFWATWCPVCQVMGGTIDGIAKDYPVIGVALQSGTRETLQTALRAAGHTFPVLSDPEGAIASRWGVQGVPTTFVIDPAGHIRFATVGVSTGPGLRLRLWVAGLQ